MAREITMGSLFDGIGGFPLAAVRSGIRPVWASEIEPFAIEVTRRRFPDMVHVGDITKLDVPRPYDLAATCRVLYDAGDNAALGGSYGEAENGMRWVQAMNNIRNRAPEVVYSDLIYN